MSDFSTVCDAIVDDLTTQVAGLAALPAARIHRYAPWSPEEFAASAGERHLAVWPAPEAETVVPLTTNSYMLEQTYIVAVWEGAAEEAGRIKVDEGAAAALLDLQNDVRARFFSAANFQLGGSDSVRPVGTALPDVVSSARWFALRVAVARSKDWTP